MSPHTPASASCRPPVRSVTHKHHSESDGARAGSKHWEETPAGPTLAAYHDCQEAVRALFRAALSDLTVVPNGFGVRPTKDGYDFHREFEQVFGPTKRAWRQP